jgi:hypothetical protein
MEKAYSVFCYSDDNQLVVADLSKAVFVVRMLSSGFCLAVLAEHEQVLALNHYTFSHGLSVEDKIDTIENVREEIHLKCGKAVFQLYTNVNTQIPEEFYEENLNKAIAELLVSKSKDYVPMGEKIADEPLYNLSLWNAALLKKVKEKFPDYELQTTMGKLLTNVLCKNSGEESFVFVEDNNFTIIAKNGNGLLAANCFAFENEADFLYYALHFLRKIYPNAETVPLTVGGNITAQSSLFTALRKYSARVKLIENTSESMRSIANYHYYCDIV